MTEKTPIYFIGNVPMFFEIMENAELKMEARSLDYHEYIASEEWKAKSEAAKIRANYRCQLCSVSGLIADLHTHHNTYERLGNERDTDLVVLCAECHKRFHDNGGKPGNSPKIPKEKFSLVLKGFGITFTNDDPYEYYERGKMIIQQVIDGFNSELYDYYNRVNIDILDAALANQEKCNFERAKDNDWDGYESELDWREANDYWKGWK